MADLSVSSLEQTQRSDNRLLLMIPVLFVLVILSLFLFGGKLFDLADKGTAGKLIFVGIYVVILFVSYLITGLIIPKSK